MWVKLLRTDSSASGTHILTIYIQTVYVQTISIYSLYILCAVCTLYIALGDDEMEGPWSIIQLTNSLTNFVKF